ncbi:MAG: hypothetical protein DRP83_02945 [Planctomycetota bacterium]|nr:MAG: hypothetical protein DRP83_02945 [Planctomycetota bacterium]
MGKGKKTLVMVMAVAMLASLAGPVLAQSAQRNAQRKLLAIRAARVDAMRKMAERIKGLRITSNTTVQDFVTENDTIETALNTFIRGMKEEGKAKFFKDGTAEVTMSVTLRTIITKLTHIYSAHYKGDKIKASDFKKMTQTNKFDKITVVGSGVVPEELDEDPLQAIPSSGRTPRPYGQAGKYWSAHCKPQGRLMAVRAARVDGMRRLAERIKGVHITSDTTVQDFVAESDNIDVNMRTFLRGAKEIGIRYHRDELIVEVEMEVTLKTVVASLKSWADVHYKGDRVKIKAMQDYVEKVRHDKITEIGMGVPPARYCKGYTSEQITVLATATKAPPWISDTMRAKGQAAIDTDSTNAAQAKLMAKRAAELDARRKLAEQIDGLLIDSDTSVRDFVAQSDEINTRMQTYQLGAHVVKGSEKFYPDGTAEVTVEIPLKPIWNLYLVSIKKVR